MYVDKSTHMDFPYYGEFYRMSIDESKPLNEQVEEKVTVYRTKCDVTESLHSWSNNFIWAKYAVYFPFDKEDGILVKIGDLFEADVYGMTINGKVIGVFPSQLGGITCYIQDIDA